jgi:hypothetical protein
MAKQSPSGKMVPKNTPDEGKVEKAGTSNSKITGQKRTGRDVAKEKRIKGA